MNHAPYEKEPEHVERPRFRIDREAKAVWWGDRRCYFGDTANFRCLAALAETLNMPVENSALLEAIGPSFICVVDDVRTAIYRLKKKLRHAGMADLAARIENVRGAYTLRLY